MTKVPFYILALTTLLMSCVPQTKQTSCGPNEAFNSSARTCVAMTADASSLIFIDDHLPTTEYLSFSKDDSIPKTMSVTISNPNSQSFTVSWKRTFNQIIYPLGSTINGNQSSITFVPRQLMSEIGQHFFTAEVRNAAGKIVASKTFTVFLNESPKPMIDNTYDSPNIYELAYSPIDAPATFKIRVKNNNSPSLNSKSFRTVWSLDMNGINILNETDQFWITSLTGFNSAEFFFNPQQRRVGNYNITARVMLGDSEIVDQKRWSIVVKHPDLAKVKARDIYKSQPGIPFDSTSIAYHEVDYTNSLRLNFKPDIDSPGSTQGDYCISFENPDGAYIDYRYIKVDYYINGSTLVYTGFTSLNKPQVCLSEAGNDIKKGILFKNTNPNETQSHALVARVTDLSTQREYTNSEMGPGLGDYPIVWNFNVKPKNQKPVVTFGDETPMDSKISCTPTNPTPPGPMPTKTCTVDSDKDFKVNIKLMSDDFYSLPADEDAFDYELALYKGSEQSPLQKCTKQDRDQDSYGNDGYECTFKIESFNSSGSIDVTNNTYQIRGFISDDGGPFNSNTRLSSDTLLWTFPVGSVRKTNTPPTIDSWKITTTSAEEEKVLSFEVSVTDLDRNRITMEVKYCTSPFVNDACTSSAVLITSSNLSVDNATGKLTTNLTSSALPQDFLLNLKAIDCNKTKRDNSCNVNFFVEISDSAEPSKKIKSINISKAIKNINPKPVIDETLFSPAPSAWTPPKPVFVGFPISINLSSGPTDTSSPNEEKQLRFQWFSKLANDPNWTEIPGATNKNLLWTPSFISPPNSEIHLRFCVEDQPVVAVSKIDATTSICNTTQWKVVVKNNILNLSSPIANGPLTESTNEMAIWHETPSIGNSPKITAAYIAGVEKDSSSKEQIYVTKVLIKENGDFDFDNTKHIITFSPKSTDINSNYSIRNLSITGNDKELYIAYSVTSTNSQRSWYEPQVRRIDLKATPAKFPPNLHTGKFGFDYDGLQITHYCNPSNSCTIVNNTINFTGTTGPTSGSIVLKTPRGDLTININSNSSNNVSCPNCGPADFATAVAKFINESLDEKLMGYSATVNPSPAGVIINGAEKGDFFEFDGYISFTGSNPITHMGNIFIHNGEWHLPLINDYTKFCFYKGRTGNKLDIFRPVFITNSTGELKEIDDPIFFETFYDGTDFWLALTNSNEEGKAYKLSFETSTTAFSKVDEITLKNASTKVSNIQITKISNNILVGFQNNGQHQLEIYNDKLNYSETIDIESVFEDTYRTLKSVRIVPYKDEARIFGIVKYDARIQSDRHQLYLARLWNNNNSWDSSCGSCQPISQRQFDVAPGIKPRVTVMMNPAPSSNSNSNTTLRLSSDGGLTNQGIRDIALVSFGSCDYNSGSTCVPSLGIFNLQPEEIPATSIYTKGLTLNTDDGLFRPPFVKK